MPSIGRFAKWTGESWVLCRPAASTDCQTPTSGASRVARLPLAISSSCHLLSVPHPRQESIANANRRDGESFGGNKVSPSNWLADLKYVAVAGELWA